MGVCGGEDYCVGVGFGVDECGEGYVECVCDFLEYVDCGCVLVEFDLFEYGVVYVGGVCEFF